MDETLSALEGAIQQLKEGRSAFHAALLRLRQANADVIACIAWLRQQPPISSITASMERP